MRARVNSEFLTFRLPKEGVQHTLERSGTPLIATRLTNCEKKDKTRGIYRISNDITFDIGLLLYIGLAVHER